MFSNVNPKVPKINFKEKTEILHRKLSVSFSFALIKVSLDKV